MTDTNQVSWDGPEDPENPKNWSFKRKWAATIVVSSFTFISPVSSSMVAPALSTIASEFHITNEVESQLVLSIFVSYQSLGFCYPTNLVKGPSICHWASIPWPSLGNIRTCTRSAACEFGVFGLQYRMRSQQKQGRDDCIPFLVRTGRQCAFSGMLDIFIFQDFD